MDMKCVGIKEALISYLQCVTDAVQSVYPPLPPIRCHILQIEPTLKLADEGIAIEAELSGSFQHIIRDFLNKWVLISNYTFARKAGGRYILIFEKMKALSSMVEGEQAEVEDCMQSEMVQRFAEIHRRAIEREKLKQFIDDMPSFDALALALPDKHPICLRPRNFDVPVTTEVYVRVGKPVSIGFMDIDLDDLEKNCVVMNEKLKIPPKCKKELVELEIEVATEDTTLEPEEEKKDYYESYGLGYLLSSFSATKPAVSSNLQSEGPMDSATKEIPASEEYAAAVHKTLEKVIGIEDKPTGTTDKKIAISRVVRKPEIMTTIVKTKKVTEIGTVAPSDFDRYQTWRNFTKQVKSTKRKLEFTNDDLPIRELVEFIPGEEAENEPLIEVDSKRKKFL